MHHAGLVVFGLLLLILVLVPGSGVAGVVILAAFAVLLALVGGVWIEDYFSDDARADRAVKAGRIGQAIRYYLRCRTAPQLDALLVTTFARREHARRAVYDAALELSELERAIGAARSIAVPRAMLDALADEVRTSGQVLWHVADRLGIAEAQGVESADIQRMVDDEATTLDGLAESLRAARTGLAELTLRGAAGQEQARVVRSVETRLRALGDAARDLASIDER